VTTSPAARPVCHTFNGAAPIGRQIVQSRDDLKAKAISALRRLQKLPQLVLGFFLDPNLAYIRE
jgi:hypothetical protein